MPPKTNQRTATKSGKRVTTATRTNLSPVASDAKELVKVEVPLLMSSHRTDVVANTFVWYDEPPAGAISATIRVPVGLPATRSTDWRAQSTKEDLPEITITYLHSDEAEHRSVSFELRGIPDMLPIAAAIVKLHEQLAHAMPSKRLFGTPQ